MHNNHRDFLGRCALLHAGMTYGDPTSLEHIFSTFLQVAHAHYNRTQGECMSYWHRANITHRSISFMLKDTIDSDFIFFILIFYFIISYNNNCIFLIFHNNHILLEVPQNNIS